MRKHNFRALVICFILCLLCDSTSVYAQAKFDQYYNSDIGRYFNIRVDNSKRYISISESNKNDTIPNIYLEVFGGVLKDTYYFSFGGDHREFVGWLILAKYEYLRWKQKAKDNDVSYTNKLMDIPFPEVDVFTFDAFDQNFTYIEKVQPLPVFTVSDVGARKYKLMLIARSSLIEDQTYSITLSNEREFEKLLSKFNVKRLEKKLSKL